jgi:hypothetical protein
MLNMKMPGMEPRQDTTPAKKPAYVCPMGDPAGNSDKSGNCPTCGMKLVPNK